MAKISFPGKLTVLFSIFWFNSQIYGFRVVLDPGHGGRYLEPTSVYGDKYDSEKARFLEGYRPGASITGLNENEDVYTISLIVKELLDLTNTPEGRIAFHKILLKYDSSAKLPFEGIETFISRKPGYQSRYWEIDYDINRDYRLYDHYDLKDQNLVEGVISKINSLQPELVVSLHLTGGNPGKHGGMSAVIAPAYNTFHHAIEYVNSPDKKRENVQKSFAQSSYANWFISQKGRSGFEWFLCDSWIYFTGYWSQPDGLNPDLTKFRGYRQNMITWNYGEALENSDDSSYMKNTAYANHLKDFNATGKFWNREKSQAEAWRRDGGLEGYGGDNLYASQELLRFMRKGLLLNNVNSKWNLPEIVTPYISTWSVPIYVNAISAFIELAYLNNKHDFKRIERQKKVHAEAIAVGIYSIFYGTKNGKDARKKNMPWGNRVDFKKYMDYADGNYFKLVRY